MGNVGYGKLGTAGSFKISTTMEKLPYERSIFSTINASVCVIVDLRPSVFKVECING